MKTYMLYSIIGAFLSIASVCILIISVMMDSPWAYVVAIIGSAAVSIMLRFTRIVNPRSSKGIVLGLIIGCLLCIFIIRWFDSSLSTTNKNVWILTTFVLTQGFVRLFISDAQLSNWYKQYSSAKSSNEIGT